MANLPSSPFLLSLAVFRSTHKPEYIRSIHLYDQNGSVFSIQQEFLLNPGSYSRISQPIPSACFQSSTSVALKHFIFVLKKMQEGNHGGWECILEFRSDCPKETTIAALLSPSRNAELKNIPTLAHDLCLVEAAVGVSDRSSCLSESAIKDDLKDANARIEENSALKNSSWSFPTLSIAPAAAETVSEQQLHELPALETPDTTPHGPQSDMWHQWGSDLELASPRISQAVELESWRNNFTDSNQGASNPSTPPTTSFVSENAADLVVWSPSCLALNSDAPDFATEETTNFTRLLSSTSPADNATMNLELGTSGSLQNSVMTEEEEGAENFDCFSLDWFGLESPTYNLNGIETKKKAVRSFYSEESIVTEPMDERMGQVVTLSHVLPPEMSIQNSESTNASGIFQENANSPATSSDVYWGGREVYGKQFQEMSNSPATSSDRNWVSTREGGRLTRRSTQAARQNPDSVHSSFHKGTSERITELTLNELSQYFNMPITQASKELKVGLTVLKKRCREFGIPRWPHRKMKSLESLINNIQDLAKDQGVKTSSRVLHAVKELEEQKRLMEEMPGTELAERTKRLRQACFKASYKRRKLQAQTMPITDQSGNISFDSDFLQDHNSLGTHAHPSLLASDFFHAPHADLLPAADPRQGLPSVQK